MVPHLVTAHLHWTAVQRPPARCGPRPVAAVAPGLGTRGGGRNRAGRRLRWIEVYVETAGTELEESVIAASLSWGACGRRGPLLSARLSDGPTMTIAVTTTGGRGQFRVVACGVAGK